MPQTERSAPPHVLIDRAKPGEVTLPQTETRSAPLRLIWELHAGQGMALEAVRLAGENPTLGHAAALLMCQPRLARAVKLRYDIGGAAQRVWEYLAGKGWTMQEIVGAGAHAMEYLLAHGMPPLADEIREVEDFSEAAPPQPPTSAGSGE